MSDEIDVQPTQSPPEDPPWLADVDRVGAELDHLTRELEEKNDRLQREVAIREAGIDLDTPLGNFFFEALKNSEHWQDEEWTPAEIRKTATAYSVPYWGERP